MSRHRHIRNMNIDDEYYDDDEEEDYGNENDGGHYDDDGYDDDEYYEEEQDKAFSINDLIGEVQSVTGRILSDEQVQKILLQNSCNVERTINQIFDGPSQGSSRQSEKLTHPAPTSAPAGGASKVKPFDFSTPSPDDVVAMARKKAPAAGLQLNQGTKPAAKTVTLPSEPPSAALASMAISQPKPTPPAARTVTPKAPPAARTQPVFTPKPPSVPAQSKKNKIDVAEEYNKRKSTKDSLNLIIVGHVDAGKSTLMGHMMCLLGEVSDRALKKNQHEAEKIKKGSFSFAWVLDATEEERNRGVTIDVAEMKFETPNRQFTLLDAPGHRDFIPNMIAGACQADVAILVVDSSPGEFEAGFDLGGQTREHALLVRALGVTQLIVAVNKLDMMEWSQERYDEICKKLGAFLVHAGFKKQKLTYIPTSGWLGENLVKREEPLLNKWYKGQTLIGQLDQLEAPTRMIDRPLRMSVSDFFKGGLGTGTGGDVSVSGRIDCGSVQLKDEVLVMPINEVAVVKAIECNHESVKWAVAGDSVTISLSGIDSQHVKKGNVLCQVGHPIPITRKIRAQIVTFDISRPLTIGVPVVFHTQSLAEAGSIKSLISILDKATGEVVKKRPRALTKNLTAEVEIELLRPLCLEKSADNKFFGRFTLRCGSQTVAAGLVMDILAYENAGDVEAV
ncbi:HBS1-like protein-like protein [Polychytrium aggregatum]|uniref:HBS1-like protein-like protein n=1 Tax=Polychytrium aggregatum TaxID=110093 RepID=UPI0022FDECAD|nr:HBS1-like protein-like protein [Polychytrium aggregatum]KAI9206512.1 HBS1-like protein-like protein [Polychytrium aggregatum]